MNEDRVGYETLTQAGYTFVCNHNVPGLYILRNGQGKLEVWASNKNHASYGLKWRNTHLEFVRDLSPYERTTTTA